MPYQYLNRTKTALKKETNLLAADTKQNTTKLKKESEGT